MLARRKHNRLVTRDDRITLHHKISQYDRYLKSLRYTQSYLDALRDVQAIGRETRLSSEGIAARVPALKIGRFTFTGVTQ